MFEASRNPKLTARDKYDTNSIKTSIGTKANGVPAGTKNEKKLRPCKKSDKIVTLKNTATLKPKATAAELVTAKP